MRTSQHARRAPPPAPIDTTRGFRGPTMAVQRQEPEESVVGGGSSRRRSWSTRSVHELEATEVARPEIHDGPETEPEELDMDDEEDYHYQLRALAAEENARDASLSVSASSSSPAAKKASSENSQNERLKQWKSKMKQRVEDIDMSRLTGLTGSSTSNPRSEGSQDGGGPSTFPVSLDPPAQARLYSELELMICVTANAFLLGQHRSGRLRPTSIYKVVRGWKAKGRPQVIEFQFDQATQREIVVANRASKDGGNGSVNGSGDTDDLGVCFHGPNAHNPRSITAMLYNWRTLSSEFAPRTFCLPDSVIRKHLLHDIQPVLELLGAPLPTLIALQELRNAALTTMHDENRRRQRRAQVKHGVETEWTPGGEVEGGYP